MNHVLFIASKQIQYVLYDESNYKLTLQYADGRKDTFFSIPQSWFEQLIRSDNQYDDVMNLAKNMTDKSLKHF